MELKLYVSLNSNANLFFGSSSETSMKINYWFSPCLFCTDVTNNLNAGGEMQGSKQVKRKAQMFLKTGRPCCSVIIFS